MRLGICGWSQSGKSIVFDCLTSASKGAGPAEHAAPGKARIGASHVPDERLDYLATIFKPKKITYALVEYIDLPGLVADAHAHDTNPKILGDVRQADALIAVVRAFENDSVASPFDTVDPVRDWNRLWDELIFADLEVADKRIKRLEVDVTKPTTTQKENELELGVLRRVKAALEEGHGASTAKMSDIEEKAVRGFRFLTAKPILVIANLGEESLGKPSKYSDADLANRATGRNSIAACPDFGRATMSMFAKLEAELSELPEEERVAFMADLGLEKLVATEVVKKGYEILDLVSFLTAGDKEVRAWTISRGTPAVEAAGVIHSDIQRGFIRAEITAYEDFKALGSFKEARAKGKLRLEGKEYVMKDGDIVEFRFSV